MQGTDKWERGGRSRDLWPQRFACDPRLAAELERISSTGSWAVSLGAGAAIHWSAGMHRIYGTDPASFTPSVESVTARIHPEDLPRLSARRRTWRKHPRAFAVAHRLIRADQAIRHVEIRAWITGGRPREADWVVGTAHDITERIEARAQRELQSARALALLKDLAHAEERERHRIAGDIHDDAIQAFEAVGLKLEGIFGQAGEQGVTADLESVCTDLRKATTRLRTLMFELTPPAEGARICDAIRIYCQRAFTGQGIDWELACDVDRIDRGWTPLVLRLLQELVRNIIKHAQATHAWVSLSSTPQSLALIVIDDGRGLRNPEAEQGHAGLRLLEDRVAAAGGSVEVARPESGQGTSVRILLPRRELGGRSG